MLKFHPSLEISTFYDIVYNFFALSQPTYFLNGWLQCPRGKRRSIVDFYQLQRYYLQEPLSFIECFHIFNSLLPTTVGGQTLYCDTIKRNTYHSSIWTLSGKHDLIKQLNVYFPEVKLKQHEKVQIN